MAHSHPLSSAKAPVASAPRDSLLPAKGGPQIVFVGPAVHNIAGGIKYFYRMAEVLQRTGRNVVVSEPHRARSSWFASDVSIVGREVLQKGAHQVLVLPEDAQSFLVNCASWPQPKVMYCQSNFYAAASAPENGQYADRGVFDILCSGQAVYDYCCRRHPRSRSYSIPYGVDPAVFQPRTKRQCIAYIPRKRPVEAVYIRDLFRFHYPEFRDVEWLSLADKSEAEVAAALGEASVFLALNRLDGFGLTPIEAMASGCVVAGFTGIGGREYATLENGFWAAEDDFSAVVRQLAQAVWLSRETGDRRLAYAAACQRTLSHYTPSVFEAAVGAAWTEILNHHA